MKKLSTYSNLNRKLTWKGVLDYKLIIILLAYFIILFNILNLFNLAIFYIVYFLILSAIPVMGMYFVISKEDNGFDLLVNIIRYMLKPKEYKYEYMDNFNEYLLLRIKKRSKSRKFNLAKFVVKNTNR